MHTLATGPGEDFALIGYPPDLQDEAVKLVVEQAEVLSGEWAV